MAGGKGGSQTTSVQIPEYIEKAAQRNLNKAEAISQIGYTPYYGPDVAAFTPMQQAAMQNTVGAASAFGMAAPSDPMAGMPQAQNFGGVMGYSSAPIYEAAVDQLRARRPGQYNAMTGLFVDPYTGAASSYRLPTIDYTTMETASAAADRRAGASAAEAAMDRANQLAIANANRDAANRSTTTINTPLSYAPGGVNTRNPASPINTAVASLTPNKTLPAGSAPTTSIRPVARPTAPTTPTTSGAKKKVICTALNELGLLPNDIYALDARFAIMMDRNDPYVGVGYRLWATPVAEYIKKDTVMAKAVRYAILPIVLPWAKEMAHVMRPKEYKSDLAGKLIMAVAHPICRFIGKAASRQTVEA